MTFITFLVVWSSGIVLKQFEDMFKYVKYLCILFIIMQK